MTETVKLKHPFEFQGEKFTEVRLRRPKVRDLKKSELEKDEFARSVNMIADLAEIPPQAVEEFDTEDFQMISDKVGEYMGVSAENPTSK